MQSRQRPDWPRIKGAYLKQEGSYRELSERFKVSFHTLSKRAKRENWAGELAKLNEAVAAVVSEKAIAKAVEQGGAIGMTAIQFFGRSVEGTQKWLDRIEEAANRPQLDPGEIRSLVSSFRDVVDVGRRTFRLDDEGPTGPVDGRNLQAIDVEIVSETTSKTLPVAIHSDPAAPIKISNSTP